jgi:hypothetical protein
MTTNKWVSRFGAALLAITCAGTVHAKERIRYEEIPSHLAPFGSVLAYRGFDVVTIDGKRHGGRRLRLESDHVRVFHMNNSYEDLASSQIAQIEIRQAGRFFHHIVNSAQIPLLGAGLACGGFFYAEHISTPCAVTVTALLSPVWVYTAATAPFYLASDGVAFLIPSKTYDIIH